MADVVQQLEAWLAAYSLAMELTVAWTLMAGFAVMAVVKAVSWWTLRGQIDKTRVGSSLKWQKLAELLMFVALTTLYALTLYAYYTDYRFTVWEEYAVLLLLFVGIVGASVWGIRFVHALLAERRTQ